MAKLFEIDLFKKSKEDCFLEKSPEVLNNEIKKAIENPEYRAVNLNLSLMRGNIDADDGETPNFLELIIVRNLDLIYDINRAIINGDEEINKKFPTRRTLYTTTYAGTNIDSYIDRILERNNLVMANVIQSCQDEVEGISMTLAEPYLMGQNNHAMRHLFSILTKEGKFDISNLTLLGEGRTKSQGTMKELEIAGLAEKDPDNDNFYYAILK